MLSVANKPSMLSVIMLNVIMLSVVALAAWVPNIFYNLYFVKKIANLLIKQQSQKLEKK
jgi:hypothetical protein